MLDLDAIFGPTDPEAETPRRAAAAPLAPPRTPPMRLAQEPPSKEICSGCGKAVDGKRRCWQCHRRACSRCGRNTGSAFIELCILCDFADGPDGG